MFWGSDLQALHLQLWYHEQLHAPSAPTANGTLDQPDKSSKKRDDAVAIVVGVLAALCGDLLLFGFYIWKKLHQSKANRAIAESKSVGNDCNLVFDPI